ncbi:hypothetical protein SM124_11845 [Bacillus sp. 31A1R]|uniref:Uncharacterized protein n=1 Tax=Robertmurraya mangrovi TaxID=3098077 RepID=A0ABU5IZ96_9BACI|nr:hypothetical protein [Bacillus sp. 31A1R]MDZ5472441.1 hypothetical protein [Bacillus sp. 31A1R]
MDKQILEVLLELQKDMKEVKTDIKEVKTEIQEIKGTVNRIEASQTEDVVGMLKVTNKKTEFEVEYLNNRLTEMDKRLFNLEKRIEN